MENFNVLFENAATVADNRKKIFNELIEKFKKEIVPPYLQSMKALGYNNFAFDQSIQVIIGQEGSAPSSSYGPRDVEFPVRIYADSTITECKYKFDGDGDLIVDFRTYKIDDAKFTKVGIVSLIKQMNYKLQVLTEKRAKQNEQAQALLNG